MSYNAEHIIGNGSFGVVFQAVVVETGEVVAIKKVGQSYFEWVQECHVDRSSLGTPHPRAGCIHSILSGVVK